MRRGSATSHIWEKDYIWDMEYFEEATTKAYGEKLACNRKKFGLTQKQGAAIAYRDAKRGRS